MELRQEMIDHIKRKTATYGKAKLVHVPNILPFPVVGFVTAGGGQQHNHPPATAANQRSRRLPSLRRRTFSPSTPPQEWDEEVAQEERYVEREDNLDVLVGLFLSVNASDWTPS